MRPVVYGIGNPLMDIVVSATDLELASLGLKKGIMYLISEHVRKRLISFIETRHRFYSCGGSAPNTIIALTTFGIPAAIAGKVGSDNFGQIYADQLKDFNVISQLVRGEGHTGSSIIMISPDSERTMNTYLGVNSDFGPEDVDEDVVAGADIFYFTGYMWDTEKQRAAVLKAAEIARSSGTKVYFDVADPEVVKRYQDDFLIFLTEKVDVAFANREEAQILFGSKNEEEAVASLTELCETGIVKLGAGGSLIKSGNVQYRIPSNLVDVIDTTGAGDMYAAGFIYGQVKGYTLKSSGICASFLASQIIRQHGAQFNPKIHDQVISALKDGSWEFTI
ncbi:MAG: adenosine kinase [Spirochaetales bacterium]|nr:adenosine kinase [Spirochaetales bacterium]